MKKVINSLATIDSDKAAKIAAVFAFSALLAFVVFVVVTRLI